MAITKISKAMMDANSLDSDSYVDGSIDNAHLAANSVDSDQYVDGSIDNAHLAANSVDSDQYVDGSIDNAHIADDAIDSEHYVDGSIDNAHLADDAVGVAELSATGTASSSTFLRGDNAWAAAGGGKVLQVVSTNITTRPTTTVTDTSGVGGDLGLSVAITPTTSTSKFLINVSIGCWNGANGSSTIGIILVRDSTRIGNGADSSSRNGVFMRGTYYYHDGNHADGTSSTYYNTTTGSAGSAITFRANGVVQSGGTMMLNRSASDTDTTNPYGSYTSSSITVTEIGA